MTQTMPLPTAADHERWLWLTRVLRFVAIFALTTGVGDVFAGSQILTAVGAKLGSRGPDPVLNSQVHYLGAMRAGFGAVIWWCTRDLRGRADLLQLLMVAVMVGGVVAAMQYGSGPPLLAFFIAVELLFPPAILLWHRSLLEALRNL